MLPTPLSRRTPAPGPRLHRPHLRPLRPAGPRGAPHHRPARRRQPEAHPARPRPGPPHQLPARPHLRPLLRPYTGLRPVPLTGSAKRWS